MTIHQQNIVTFILSGLNKGVLIVLVGAVQVHQAVVLIGLITLNKVFVLLKGEVLAFGILKEGEFGRPVVKLLFGKHAVLDKQLQVVPLFLESLPIEIGRASCRERV